jgi:hypothetical protein
MLPFWIEAQVAGVGRGMVGMKFGIIIWGQAVANFGKVMNDWRRWKTIVANQTDDRAVLGFTSS